MKNQNPARRKLRPYGARQRLPAIIVLLVFAALVWILWSGRFDEELQQIAAWVRGHYRNLVD